MTDLRKRHTTSRICRNCGKAYTPTCKGEQCEKHPKRYTMDNLEDWGG